MHTQDSSDYEQPIQVKLTKAERSLILSLLTIELEVDRLLQEAEVNDGVVEITLTPEDLDELIGTVAFEANHTDDRKLQDQLDELCAKLDGLLSEG